MNILLIFVVIAVGVINLTEARIFPKPMNEDRKYWHDYNIKYVKNILKSYPGVKAERAKNVILFVGDGMSIGTISAGRVLKGQLAGNSGEETDLIFESFSHLGLSKTYNTDSQVPDSAGKKLNKGLFVHFVTFNFRFCLVTGLDVKKNDKF